MELFLSNQYSGVTKSLALFLFGHQRSLHWSALCVSIHGKRAPYLSGIW